MGTAGPDGGHLPWWGHGQGGTGLGGPKAQLMLGEGLGWSHTMGTCSLLGQEGRGRKTGQGKAFPCGLSHGITASLQMQKPQRSRC